MKFYKSSRVRKASFDRLIHERNTPAGIDMILLRARKHLLFAPSPPSLPSVFCCARINVLLILRFQFLTQFKTLGFRLLEIIQFAFLLEK